MRLTLGAPAQRQATNILVVLYLNLGHWRIRGEFRVWRGKQTSPLNWHLLLATVPRALTLDAPVIVLADTEFGTVEFLQRCQRGWRGW